MNTPERRHCRRSVVIIVNVELISHLLLMFLLLTLNSKCLLGIFNLSKKKIESLTWKESNLTSSNFISVDPPLFITSVESSSYWGIYLVSSFLS